MRDTERRLRESKYALSVEDKDAFVHMETTRTVVDICFSCMIVVKYFSHMQNDGVPKLWKRENK